MVRRQGTRNKQPSVTLQLRRAIDECGLSRYEIAKRAGIEQSALSRFMTGERGLTTPALDRLGELLDLEIVMHRPTPARSAVVKGKPKGR